MLVFCSGLSILNKVGARNGYTKAFPDSDGVAHGKAFGEVLTAYSDPALTTGKARNRLYALEMKHREAGRDIERTGKVPRSGDHPFTPCRETGLAGTFSGGTGRP
jgi:hypothetical protein